MQVYFRFSERGAFQSVHLDDESRDSAARILQALERYFGFLAGTLDAYRVYNYQDAIYVSP